MKRVGELYADTLTEMEQIVSSEKQNLDEVNESYQIALRLNRLRQSPNIRQLVQLSNTLSKRLDVHLGYLRKMEKAVEQFKRHADTFSFDNKKNIEDDLEYGSFRSAILKRRK